MKLGPTKYIKVVQAQTWLEFPCHAESYQAWKWSRSQENDHVIKLKTAMCELAARNTAEYWATLNSRY